MMGAFRIGAMAAALVAASGGAAQQPSVQQAFESATALDDKGDHAAALAAWEALEARVGGNPRSVATVRVCKSASLFALDRKEEAVEAARAGLADLPADDKTLTEDRFTAYRHLGDIAESALDYASAAEAYRQAAALAPEPALKAAMLRGLIQSDIFIDPERAGQELDEADALLATLTIEKKARALFDQLRAEWLLNRQDFEGARKAADRAVDELGGLTSRSDLFDVAARSDYAIAALLGGHEDEARKYMAYTGAGRLPKGEFDPGVQMMVPDCGGEDGLKPDDVAVVQFSIGENGAVIESRPIYASGGGEAALAFARTARQWSWRPDQVKQLPPFFRYRARVELRCSTAFERPSVGAYLGRELINWLDDQGATLPPLPTGSDADVLPQERKLLADAEASKGADSLAVVPLLQLLAGNTVVGREETNALARRGVTILRAHHAPPRAVLALQQTAWTSETPEGWSTKDYRRAVTPALSDPFYAADPQARSAVRLLLADAIRRNDEDRARTLLRQVADDDALVANHPLKVGALVRLASLETAEGNVDAARAAFERSGLDASQCALVDAPPKPVRMGSRSSDFPDEAARWGFEGWTNVQYDIAADGHTANQRVIVSYPPFIFTKASGALIGRTLYEKTYRPDGGLGCGGERQRVRFLMG